MIEKGTHLRVKLIGTRSDVGSMFAIGSIKEDFLGFEHPNSFKFSDVDALLGHYEFSSQWTGAQSDLLKGQPLPGIPPLDCSCTIYVRSRIENSTQVGLDMHHNLCSVAKSQQNEYTIARDYS